MMGGGGRTRENGTKGAEAASTAKESALRRAAGDIK